MYRSCIETAKRQRAYVVRWQAPENIRRQLHRSQADVSEAEGQAEELAEQWQSIFDFSIGLEEEGKQK